MVQKEYEYDWQVPKDEFLSNWSNEKIGKIVVCFSIEAKNVNFLFEGGQSLEKMTKKYIYFETDDTVKNRNIVKEFHGKIKETEESSYSYFKREHKRKVLKAIEEGKEVPQEVLKDYQITGIQSE